MITPGQRYTVRDNTLRKLIRQRYRRVIMDKPFLILAFVSLMLSGLCLNLTLENTKLSFENINIRTESRLDCTFNEGGK